MGPLTLKYIGAGPLTLKYIRSTFFHFCFNLSFCWQVIYVIQADPKGWIPKWAVNMFAWQQALNVARIRKIIEVQSYVFIPNDLFSHSGVLDFVQNVLIMDINTCIQSVIPWLLWCALGWYN